MGGEGDVVRVRVLRPRPGRRTLALALVAVAASVLAAPAAAEVRIALLQGEQLVWVERPGSTPRDAVAALLRGPTAAEAKRGIRTLVPERTRLRDVTLTGRVAVVDVSARFASDAVAEHLTARVAQLVLTSTRFAGVRSVRLLVEGGTPLGLFPGIVALYPLTAASVLAPDQPPPAEVEPEPTGLRSGATKAIQERLVELGFLAPGAADGRPGPQTSTALLGFQKWAGLSRDGLAGPETLARLERAARPTPRAAGTGRRVEVLLDRQLALVIDGGRVVRALHISTGKPGFGTPAGSFRVYRKEVRSWSVPYRVWMPWASYFVGGIAFHEYPDVPATPASHGCIRVPAWDARWLYDQTPNGTPVTVLSSSR
jgi:peptidoglycan hydrolase-like protein with peptidoglycan-binding domain